MQIRVQKCGIGLQQRYARVGGAAPIRVTFSFDAKAGRGRTFQRQVRSYDLSNRTGRVVCHIELVQLTIMADQRGDRLRGITANNTSQWPRTVCFH